MDEWTTLRGLDADTYAAKVSDWMFNDERLTALIPMVQQRAETSDLVPLVDYLLVRADL